VETYTGTKITPAESAPAPDALSALSLDDYQNRARSTAIYPDSMQVIYPVMELAGEVGEVADKVKKVYRDHGGEFTPEAVEDLKAELGDVLWPLANLCADLDLGLEEVAIGNLEKLRSRQDRGALQGSGDQR